MHELPITKNILTIALENAKKADAKRVNKIKITAGEMTNYVPVCVQEYFNILSKGTIAEKAKLEFVKIPASAICLDCNMETVLQGFKFICVHCGSHNLKLIHGREFLVDSIDIDT